MNRKAYTLIEVMIAGALLLIGIGAAALLANSMFRQQFSSSETLRALNMQEQAVKLFQLGLEPDEIGNILPAKVAATAPPGAAEIFLQFTTNSEVIADLGIEVVTGTCRIVFATGEDNEGNPVHRTNTVTIVRPSTLR